MKWWIIGSSLVNIGRTHTAELEDLLCHVLEHQPGFKLASKSVWLGHFFRSQNCWGAELWNTCTLQGELWEQELMGGGSLLVLMQSSKANSTPKSMWNLQFTANLFCWLCHTQFPKEEAGELSFICMSFTSLSLAENTLCYSMDSSFLIHCSNYVLQPEYGTYVKADG